MMDQPPKVVLITGASSGIGEATARLLAKTGAVVLLGARRTDRLEKIATELRAGGATVEYRALDVTDLEDTRAFAAFACERFGRIDVLFNNAGVMPLSRLEELKTVERQRMLDVNIGGVLHGIAAVLPRMRPQGCGHVVNLSSIGGHAVHPTADVYSATKVAVIAISEGLRVEMAEQNIRVTVISPGVTESELADSISDEHARSAMQAFRKGAIPAEAIARAIVYALQQPPEVSVSEMIVRLATSPPAIPAPSRGPPHQST